MTRKPLRLLVSEFVADEFNRSGLSVREFAKKTSLSHSTIQKLRYPDSGGIRTDIVDSIINNLDSSLEHIINTYGEYEQ